MSLAALTLAVGLVAATPAQSQTTPRPDQFDLVCNGLEELQLYDFGSTGAGSIASFVKRPKMEPWSGVFRVDLARNLWCEDKCTEVYDPAVAKPNILVLVETNRAGARSRTVFEATDGTLLALKGYGSSIIPTRAHCRLQPFTGIPDDAPRVGGRLDPKAEPYPTE
jgi:hypothetical protein